MKRSGRLTRKTPLETRTALKRTTALTASPLARSSLHSAQPGHQSPATRRRPKDTGPSKAVTIAVLERDAYCCFVCGGALWGERGYDFSLQHRRARGSGGSRRPDTNQPQNLISVCGSATSPGGCHSSIESRRSWARENGWAIRQSENPLELPVLHWQMRLIFLRADGSWSLRPIAEEANQ